MAREKIFEKKNPGEGEFGLGEFEDVRAAWRSECRRANGSVELAVWNPGKGEGQKGAAVTSTREDSHVEVVEEAFRGEHVFGDNSSVRTRKDERREGQSEYVSVPVRIEALTAQPQTCALSPSILLADVVDPS